ncbi:MAG: uracil-DNA glycosylase [Oligoflexales bacterium]|nr:uracil-DNA glycosylase [Oligoflexales bacterium]
MLTGTWNELLKDEFAKPYMSELDTFLQGEIANGKQVLPEPQQYFAALNSAALEDVKVVILGQDPYPTPGNPHGLSFSVQDGVRVPASLANIFKEQENDLGIIQPRDNGNLTPWAEQGVLLLNTVLTVEAHKAGSHRNRGWEIFTDKIISVLNSQKSPIVFLLWGKVAQDKETLLDNAEHLILKAAHPSPFAAKAFFGNRHFSKTNEFLAAKGLTEIQWQLQQGRQ